jgi:UDP-N-acetylglucosamine--N-acetylmuramyl-(pentapeptide) pyrophosphoryl-undecaprenol N-acetylglucosamine transferase
VLVFGGSLGALRLNEAAPRAFADPAYRVIHASGRRDFDRLRTPGPHYDLRPYISPLGPALLAADLVVARAGGSVFEIAAHGRPAVLVPYPHATGDHQATNAAWMERAGAAVVVPDGELTPERLRAEVDALFAEPERLARMGEASRALARPDAAAAVAAEVARATVRT